MCGIIGFIGKQNAVPFILNGLKNLEYRGYDSAGISIKQNDSISTIKEVGEIKNLEAAITSNFIGNIGIGHTRWATHGEINQTNSHPHLSISGNISIVHNGIIENYNELKNELEALGYKHQSSTDSEVVANLIEYYSTQEKTLFDAISKAQDTLKGSFAIAIINNNTNSITCIKHKSPLCVGKISDGELMVSSDPSSISAHTNEFIFLNDGEIIELIQKDEDVEVKLYKNKEKISHTFDRLNIENEEDNLKGYPNNMLKEIEEQPEIINKILSTYLNKDNDFSKEKELLSIINNNTASIWFVACGTSYFAGKLGTSLLNQYSKANIFSCLASEFDAFAHRVDENSVVITISQSGETADNISVLKNVLNKGAKVISLTNASYSTIAQLSHLNFDIMAKKERSVASTKAFSASIVVLYLIALSFLKSRSEIDTNEYNKIISNLRNIPKQTNIIINQYKPKIEELAKILYKKDKTIFLGKYTNYIVACEGSLKLKEITYIHSEAIPAGELKHGPLALIEKGFPIISIFNNSENSVINESKIISSIIETKSRGALNINITNNKTTDVENISEHNIYLNAESDISFHINSAIVLQYLSYFTASLKNLNIDRPRNLAKSVTVE